MELNNKPFILTIILLSLIEWGILKPFNSVGFYCNDPKLQFENRGDTVSIKPLLLVSFVLPYFIFLFVERYLRLKNKRSSKENINNAKWINRTHYWFFKYLHGLCFTFLVTDLVKLIVGEPRPHFFHTCQPREAANCTTGQYIAEYTCTNAVNSKILTDSYKSFPSGHAAFSSYFSVFIIFYLAKEIMTDSYFLVNFLEICCIFWTLLCSLTRITDHRHHWWDVLTGSILGSTIALYFTSYQIAKKYEDLSHTGNKEIHKNVKSNLIS